MERRMAHNRSTDRLKNDPAHERDPEAMAFDIVFLDEEHEQYEQEIRDFCGIHTHPRNMAFLHLPVGGPDVDLMLDCEWDEDRQLMIVSQLAEGVGVEINVDDLPPDHSFRQVVRPN